MEAYLHGVSTRKVHELIKSFCAHTAIRTSDRWQGRLQFLTGGLHTSCCPWRPGRMFSRLSLIHSLTAGAGGASSPVSTTVTSSDHSVSM